jgi:hypothetical protein
MGAAAGLQADTAGRQAGKECQHLRAAQTSPHQHFASLGNGVHLKHGLGQIQPDGANLLHGTVLPLVSMNSTTLGTFRCRLEGPFHTITEALEALGKPGIDMIENGGERGGGGGHEARHPG